MQKNKYRETPIMFKIKNESKKNKKFNKKNKKISKNQVDEKIYLYCKLWKFKFNNL